MADSTLFGNINIDEAIANSFKDFHVKGFDYICLKRSPKLTLKLYILDGDVSKLPEVVNPHDHRYDFKTTVLCGAMENVTYLEKSGITARTYNRFSYCTPLNGGNGFTWDKEVELRPFNRLILEKDEAYQMLSYGIHTIRMLQNETVMLLEQYEDVVPLDAHTFTYCQTATPPSLEGLYSRFTADQLLQRLKRIEERVSLKDV